jgi:hypothetical protein
MKMKNILYKEIVIREKISKTYFDIKFITLEI